MAAVHGLGRGWGLRPRDHPTTTAITGRYPRPAASSVGRAGVICHASQHHREEDHTVLRAQRTWLQRQRVLRHDARPSSNDVLELNVAGRMLLTQRSTLMQVPGSRLRHMFDPLRDSLLPRDSKGVIFLDYDPDAFTALLRYLRELRAAGGAAAAVPMPELGRAEMAVVRHLLETPMATRSSPDLNGNPYASRPAPNSSSRTAPARSSSGAPVLGNNSCPMPHAQPLRPLKRPVAPPGSPAASAAQASSSAASSRKAWGGTLPLASSTGPGMALEPDVVCSRLLYVRTGAGAAPSGPAASGSSGTSSSAPGSSSSGGGGGSTPRQGLKVSVLTEGDLAALPGQPAYSLMCDVTQTSQQLSFSFTMRNSAGFDNMYIGVTTTSQVHQRGLQIPSFGWKQYGSRPLDGAVSSAAGIDHRNGDSGGSSSRTEGTAQDLQQRWRDQLASWTKEQEQAALALQQAAQGGAAAASRQAANRGAPHQQQQQQQLAGQPAVNVGQAQDAGGQQQGLWRVGDHVELIIDMGAFHSVALRVNGSKVDTLRGLPSSSNWCCYMALFCGMDVACLVFERDSYSVCGGDYKLVRYLE